MISFLVVLIFGLAVYGFILNSSKARALAEFNILHSQPHYHGLYSAFMTIVPAIILLIFWSFIVNMISNITLKDFFSDVTDDGLVKFYTEGVIAYVEGTTDRIIDHVGFIPAVEHYQSLQSSNQILKFAVVLMLTLILFKHSLKFVEVTFKARDFIEPVSYTHLRAHETR